MRARKIVIEIYIDCGFVYAEVFLDLKRHSTLLMMKYY